MSTFTIEQGYSNLNQSTSTICQKEQEEEEEDSFSST